MFVFVALYLFVTIKVRFLIKKETGTEVPAFNPTMGLIPSPIKT